MSILVCVLLSCKSVAHSYDVFFGNDMIFFFFKQKTAYEMRISDWSSDVCSSDLDSLTHTELSGLNLSVNIVTDKDAKFTIVIDPGSQDALAIQGEAEQIGRA